MGRKIFAYKKSVKLTRKQRNELSEEGFLPIACEFLDDIRVIETFPDVDNTWLLTCAMDLLLNSTQYGTSLRNEFGQKVLTHLREQLEPE